MRWILVTGAAVLVLSACSSAPSTLSPADNITIDCPAAALAIADYSESFTAMLSALEADDAQAAAPAAAAFGLAAGAIVDQLPGVPPEAQTFVSTSQSFAERVRDVVSGNGDLAPIADEAAQAFGDADFTDSVGSVESFFRQSCPTTIIPTPSPTAA